MWSYVQYIAPTPAKAAAQQIIDALSGKLTSISYNDGAHETADPIDDVIASGLVPQCAMKVQRVGGEGSDLSLFSADEPCGCYFDFKATGATTCTTCSTSTPCATGMCRRGYCEAK
jgi:hypothetical protein